jgi:hypothetical protein
MNRMSLLGWILCMLSGLVSITLITWAYTVIF